MKKLSFSDQRELKRLGVSGPVVSYEGRFISLHKSSFNFLSTKIPIENFNYCQVLIDKDNPQFRDYVWLKPCNQGEFGARKVNNQSISLSSVSSGIKKPSAGRKFLYSVAWDDKVKALCAKIVISTIN